MEGLMVGQEPGAPRLLLQFLAWVEARDRSYGETMEAWRTSCPRLSIWEDALGEGLVALAPAPAARQREVRVMLTEAGRAQLVRHGEVRHGEVRHGEVRMERMPAC